MKATLSLIFAVSLLANGCAQASLPAAKSDADFAAAWSSGAEITSFSLMQSRYGETHPGHAELIFAQEPFRSDTHVKADTPGPTAVPTLKLNALRTFNTGLYSYRTMQSTFAPIDRTAFPHVLKTNLSIQDWCGQVFQQLNRRDGQWQHQLFSYFESAGDQNNTLDGVWLEDELWLLVRRDPAALPTGDFQMIPSLLDNRFSHRETAPATAQGTLDVGQEVTAYTLSYPRLDRRIEIRFNTKFPHFIQGWTETTRGQTTTATRQGGMGQTEYWRLNQRKHAPLRQKLDLEEDAN